MQEKGVFLNRTPSQRNDIKTYDLKNKKRDRSVALKSGLLDKSHREALDSRLALHNKQKASKALSRNINHDSFEDHIAPNMKDYSTVVESSLKKRKTKQVLSEQSQQSNTFVAKVQLNAILVSAKDFQREIMDSLLSQTDANQVI